LSGQGDGQARHECHRLAMPKDLILLRGAAQARMGRGHSKENRVGRGCVLFSHEAPLDFGEYPGCFEKGRRGDLCFGTIDSWLVYKLTGGRLHITDVSNASRTMLFNINSLAWDADILSRLGIPNSVLPAVRDSSECYGETASELFQGVSIPIAGVAGDQQSSLFGQRCFQKYSIKNTYGTGCFLLTNTGEQPFSQKMGCLPRSGGNWVIG